MEYREAIEESKESLMTTIEAIANHKGEMSELFEDVSTEIINLINLSFMAGKANE